MSVKGTDNFCKVRGLIDRFNESRSNIASGVLKTSDESMSAIQFCTFPKGDLPHCSNFYKSGVTGGIDRECGMF